MSNGKIAIVTGGSRGIGRGVAEALLKEGWKVWICSRDPKQAVQEMGGKIDGRPVDVRSQEQVDAFVKEVLDAEGRVDLLVNNAGLGRFASVEELTGDQWREVIETNLNGPFYFLHAVAPAMKRQGGGWIVNIASLAAKNPFAGGAAYNASKFGLLGFSEASMLDLRKHGIRIASILPGSVNTEFGGNRAEADWKLQPSDIAGMVLHLVSYPDNALPSLVEMRPSKPPGK
ncbi:MAG TPA: SDR family oxidoreductase [Thermoanaerobaculia bacterium]|jgi:NAD(P)-dependent dehydrogenase (short-subunit alcohol dehydrogenase family)|nr:SDR family oxidoreductase [Thermoanaerobaculia bacterium]